MATRKKSMYDTGVNFSAGEIQGMIYGGSFLDAKPDRRLALVKMAKEIKSACNISIPTKDYSVPNPDDLSAGVLNAVKLIAEGNDLYVGCMGGIGRTGLFIACMLKVSADFYGDVLFDPVEAVKATYDPRAVETDEQKEVARNFDTKEAVAYLKSRQIGTLKSTIEKLSNNSFVESEALRNRIDKYQERLLEVNSRSAWQRFKEVFAPKSY